MTRSDKLILLIKAITKQFAEEAKVVHFLGFIIDEIPNLLDKYNKKFAPPADPTKWNTPGKENS